MFLTNWQENQETLSCIRKIVFIEEQNVPENLEWDGEDPGCMHVLACDMSGKAIGTCRVMKDGHIGRMAVLPEWRMNGIGTRMLQILLCYCKEHKLTPYLDAQLHATGFYQKYGFRVQGDIFMDAGIPHKRMVYEPGFE